MAMFGTARGGRDGGPSASSPSGGSGAKRGAFSIVGPDVMITGNIVATADLHIDGRIDGDVQCGALVQGSDSHIKGAITAETARLAGSIDGSVVVRVLTVERTARISGDLDYESVTIENGAVIDGRMRHVGSDPLPALLENPASVAPHHDMLPLAASEPSA